MNTDNHSVIRIKGARQHNLDNLDVEIPRNRLVVITGLSGSGKSSLAFDTLYAEGQRKYVESLSAYARQFLDQMQKPEVDYIEGLSPAIAIEQRTSAANPRSTIATTTEIYDYLRLLFAAVGRPHDPLTGEPVVRQTPQQIADAILSSPEGTKTMLLAPLVTKQPGEFRDVIEKARREGFVRLRIDGEIIELGTASAPKLSKTESHTIEAVVDRLSIREEIRQRLADSIETSLRWGGGMLTVIRMEPGNEKWTEQKFSTDYCNPSTGFTMPKLTPKHFSFNSHLGACPACHGIGTELFFDADLMVDKSKTLEQGAIKPWRVGHKRMKQYYGAILNGLLTDSPVPTDVPFKDLPAHFKSLLFFGSGDRAITIQVTADRRVSKTFEGLVAQMQRLFETSESEFTKKRLRAFQSRRVCGVCRGARLRPEILAVTISDQERQQYNINQFCSFPISEAGKLLARIALSGADEEIVRDVLREIRQRLKFLNEVGLGYLQLNRESGTLSGGEAQRIRLATQIGSGLAGVLYVLDEPSIGLHQRDNDRLIATLRALRDLGNSVIVVEHDEDTIRAADHILDLGPGAGPRGGRIVAQGTLEEILGCEDSLTAQYLKKTLKISVPRHRVPPRQERGLAGEIGDGWLTVFGARENNLKNITAAIPVGCLTCVTGVSGSGKSTLINDILRAALAQSLNGAKERPGAFDEIVGIEQFDKVVVIDQTPVGRTPRSNPATYSGALGPIRDLFSELPAARVRGYDASRFSFNAKGGRCEHCQGDGFIKIEMHFLADVYVECEVCRGRRYNRETLEITYKGKNIADVLEMTVDESARFFRSIPALAGKLETLQDVGLGYLRLGQSATTLSGGEAQRLKLASELARRATGRTVYLLDEPTTGLHFADIHKLLEVLIKLRDAHNTLVVIEHNLEVIKCADWIIDLGPEGGEDGGRVVCDGPPERVAQDPTSYTGRYLARALASSMKIAMLFLLIAAASAFGVDVRIDEARRALEDGLPQVAIYNLSQASGKEFPRGEQATAELLLARALFAAGRFEESAALLKKSGKADSDARFWLAEANAALNKPAEALALYESLSQDERYSPQAAVGAARMLSAFGRMAEAAQVLSDLLKKNPAASGDAALELAQIRLDAKDHAGALSALSSAEGLSPEQQQQAIFLTARALLAAGQAADAEQKLTEIKDPPARLAAHLAVTMAECRLQQGDAAEAERIMEGFIAENSRLPGLPDAFEALDRIYAYGGAASSAELRRWAADSRNVQRAALALFYLARNEARASKSEKSRQLFREFLTQYPSHFLADEARAELSASQISVNQPQAALQTAKEGAGFRNSFVRAQAEAALGEFKQAADSFLQAAGAPDLEMAALENAAVCALLSGASESQNPAMRRLVARPDLQPVVDRIRFLEAMRQASRRSSTSPDLLQKIAESNSSYAQRARLALAELADSKLNSDEARATLQRISSDDPATKERTDYLAIFVADDGDRENEAEIIKLAENFLNTYPSSRFEPQVRMKWGEILYRRGDYLNARAQFNALAERFPDSPLAEKAIFLSGQAMARSLNPSEMEEAIEVFEQVVKSGGPLSLKARLAQASLLNALKRPKEALGVLDKILDSDPEPNLRYAVIVEKGDTLFAQGNQDPENYKSAIAAWRQISGDPQAPKMWSHQALAKMGAAYEKLGNTDAALDCYYGVFSEGQKAGPEFFWFYRAGFDAGRLLESQRLWKEAIAVYEKIGSVEGPRAEEARERVNRLRLENFIWDS